MKLIDLTPKIQKAAEMPFFNGYFKCINRLGEEPDAKMDWDREDGESWGRLFHSGKIVAIFHGSMPLIFIQKSKLEIISVLPGLERIVVIEVDDWDSTHFFGDEELLKKKLMWHSELPTASFSINDLWYSTI